MGAPREMYAERYILAMLYFNTDLLGWSNQAGWLSSSLSVCEWAGIICNRDLRVQEIDLGESFRHSLCCRAMSLWGSIAPSFAFECSLQRRIIYQDPFHGNLVSQRCLAPTFFLNGHY